MTVVYFLILFFCHKYELKFLHKYTLFFYGIGLEFLELLYKIVFLTFEASWTGFLLSNLGYFIFFLKKINF